MSLSQKIKEQARALGFQKVGIAPAGPLDASAQRLAEWLERGFQNEMHWMTKRQAERADINKYYPEARSVIVVGMNYFTGRSSDEMKSSYKISNYAWGVDYHLLIKKRLKELLNYIETETEGVEGLCCVDTSPVLEKAWAQQAGLGWQGKHTNLITRDYGSWLFLGEIPVNIELEYDEPFPSDYCGDCMACINACPTGALKPYTLDAGKCISYLTIEHRGSIPEPQSGQMEGWIYGCDICQEVCPWNHKSTRPTDEVQFRILPEIKGMTDSDWRSLSEDRFQNLFSKSAIKRTKHSGLKRNIELNTSID